MEALLVIAIIIGLCLCIGVRIELIIFGVICLIVLILAVMFIMFTYSLICLLFSKKKTAKFVRIDKNGKMNSAVYLVDGEEYFCLFPSEAIFRKKIYNPEKTCSVRLNKGINRVFDTNAVATCITGFIFSTASFGLAAAFIYVILTAAKGV